MKRASSDTTTSLALDPPPPPLCRCGFVGGSRYTCGHALAHFDEEVKHAHVLRLDDLAIWCHR
ncbi:hypothetical protein EON68_02175, partial [archaeon]